MTESELRFVAGFLNRLPFVKWDRFVHGDELTAYGWIERDDDLFDFVILTFSSLSQHPGFTTSSAERSFEIHQALYSDLEAELDGDEHIPCQRVEDVFGDLVEWKVVLA